MSIMCCSTHNVKQAKEITQIYLVQKSFKIIIYKISKREFLRSSFIGWTVVCLGSVQHIMVFLFCMLQSLTFEKYTEIFHIMN